MTFDIPPSCLPALTPCWVADVLISATLPVGEVDAGAHYLVPITGGRFEGVLDPASDAPVPFSGSVLSGGFDMQRQRGDGMKELEAIYHMQTDDGVIIGIRNHCLVRRNAAGGLDYARSKLSVQAPEGRYAWLNTRVFVGALQVIAPMEQVRIFSFVVE